MKLLPLSPDQAVAAMEFIEQAKSHLKAQGIDQWQQGYPNLAAVELDIAAGKARFMAVDGKPVGYLCLEWDGEPAYDTLQGDWLQAGAYVAVHRFTVGTAYHGKGYATAAFHAVAAFCKENGFPAMRVDTHPDNREMQRVLQKAGFTYCGDVWYEVSGKRLAFEKLI